MRPSLEASVRRAALQPLPIVGHRWFASKGGVGTSEMPPGESMPVHIDPGTQKTRRRVELRRIPLRVESRGVNVPMNPTFARSPLGVEHELVAIKTPGPMVWIVRFLRLRYIHDIRSIRKGSVPSPNARRDRCSHLSLHPREEARKETLIVCP